MQRKLRETRLAKVTKQMFPGVLKQLWEQLRPSYLAGGFRGAGLCPFNPNRIDKRKFLPSVALTGAPTMQQHPATSVSVAASSASGLPVIVVRQETPLSPKSAMRCSVEKCILGPQNPSPLVSRNTRTKAQNFYGQVLTEETALAALAERERKRRRKNR